MMQKTREPGLGNRLLKQQGSLTFSFGHRAQAAFAIQLSITVLRAADMSWVVAADRKGQGCSHCGVGQVNYLGADKTGREFAADFSQGAEEMGVDFLSTARTEGGPASYRLEEAEMTAVHVIRFTE